LGLEVTHRHDRVDSPCPAAVVLNADRPDLELLVIELEDDAVVIVSLGSSRAAGSVLESVARVIFAPLATEDRAAAQYVGMGQ
jgi:hypothetical protein